jgi:hypothetical protein
MDILTTPLGAAGALAENALANAADKGLNAPSIDYDFLKPIHLGGHFTAK